MQERKQPKRLIITAGDARVGKSTISRLLLELYCELNLKCLAYYNGSRNQLAAYELLVPVGELTLDRGGADRLLVDLERCIDIDVVEISALTRRHSSVSANRASVVVAISFLT